MKKEFVPSTIPKIGLLLKGGIFFLLISLLINGSVFSKTMTILVCVVYGIIYSKSRSYVKRIEIDNNELVLIFKNGDNNTHILLSELKIDETTVPGARGVRLKVFQFKRNDTVVQTIHPDISGWTQEQLLNIKQEAEERNISIQ